MRSQCICIKQALVRLIVIYSHKVLFNGINNQLALIVLCCSDVGIHGELAEFPHQADACTHISTISFITSLANFSPLSFRDILPRNVNAEEYFHN